MDIDMDKLKRLSLIEFGEDDKLVKDLKRIIEFFNKIESVDTEGIEPLYHVLDIYGKLREDLPIEKNTIEWIRKHSNTMRSYIIGPRTITEE